MLEPTRIRINIQMHLEITYIEMSCTKMKYSSLRGIWKGAVVLCLK